MVPIADPTAGARSPPGDIGQRADKRSRVRGPRPAHWGPFSRGSCLARPPSILLKGVANYRGPLDHSLRTHNGENDDAGAGKERREEGRARLGDRRSRCEEGNGTAAPGRPDSGPRRQTCRKEGRSCHSARSEPCGRPTAARSPGENLGRVGRGSSVGRVDPRRGDRRRRAPPPGVPAQPLSLARALAEARLALFFGQPVRADSHGLRSSQKGWRAS